MHPVIRKLLPDAVCGMEPLHTHGVNADETYIPEDAKTLAIRRQDLQGGSCRSLIQYSTETEKSIRDLIQLAAGKTPEGRSAIKFPVICDYLSRVGLCARDYVNRDVDSSLSGGELIPYFYPLETDRGLEGKADPQICAFRSRKPALTCGALTT